jgi:YfiH family protein
MDLFDFTLKNEEKLSLLKDESLSKIDFIKHCFTTRGGGVSEGIYKSLNLSFTRGDDEAAVLENYRRVAEYFGKTIEEFVCTDQTHTTNVMRVGREQKGFGVTRERSYTDIDGLVTDEPGIILSAFFADCVPLYFVDPAHRAIGLSHSGWRGTVGRMGRSTIDMMAKDFKSRPEDIITLIGPSICRDCYEVSEDVAEEFIREFKGHEKEILVKKGGGKYQLDLWRANEIVMTDAGIKPENISVAGNCTCCNPDLLFSHRASHGKRGNLGAFLMIRDF